MSAFPRHRAQQSFSRDDREFKRPAITRLIRKATESIAGNGIVRKTAMSLQTYWVKEARQSDILWAEGLIPIVAGVNYPAGRVPRDRYIYIYIPHIYTNMALPMHGLRLNMWALFSVSYGRIESVEKQTRYYASRLDVKLN